VRKPGQFLPSMVGFMIVGGVGVAFGTRLGRMFATVGTIGALLSWLDIVWARRHRRGEGG
jgi:hypothetical protein